MAHDEGTTAADAPHAERAARTVGISAEASFADQRVLIEELVEAVAIFPDHLKVKVAGAPKINVLLGGVGLKESADVRVGGASCTLTPHTQSDWIPLPAAA